MLSLVSKSYSRQHDRTNVSRMPQLYAVYNCPRAGAYEGLVHELLSPRRALNAHRAARRLVDHFNRVVQSALAFGMAEQRERRWSEFGWAPVLPATPFGLTRAKERTSFDVDEE